MSAISEDEPAINVQKGHSSITVSENKACSEKIKVKNTLARRKGVLTRHLNIANSLLGKNSSKSKLSEISRKIENSLELLEKPNESYESFLDEKEALENGLLMNEVFKKANECIERIALELVQRCNENPSESGSLSSSATTRSSKSSNVSAASKANKKAKLIMLEIQQRKQDAELAAEKRKNEERLVQLSEQRKIKELEYQAERLKVETEFELERDPENIINCLKDFDDGEENPAPPELPIPVATAYSTPLNTADKPQDNTFILQSQRRSSNEPECLNKSWVRTFCASMVPAPSPFQSNFKSSLPKLKVPEFSGDPLEWPSFISLFKCLVHDQPITDTQRMTYLQESLTGDAKDAIGGMLNHGHLYKTALLELEEQFGNEELVAGKYLNTVFTFPKVAEDDVNALKSYSNTLHVAVTTIASLQFHHDLAATDNVRRAVAKLPQNLRYKWGEKKAASKAQVKLTMSDLDEWLRARMRARTCADYIPLGSSRTPLQGNSKRKSSYVRENKPIQNSVQRSTLATGFKKEHNKVNKRSSNERINKGEKSTENGNDARQLQFPESSCFCCQRSHATVDCVKFKCMDVNQRAEFAKEKNLCFLCLNSNDHMARKCDKGSTCGTDGCTNNITL